MTRVNLQFRDIFQTFGKGKAEHVKYISKFEELGEFHFKLNGYGLLELPLWHGQDQADQFLHFFEIIRRSRVERLGPHGHVRISEIH